VRHLEELTSVIGVGLDAMDIVRTGSTAEGGEVAISGMPKAFLKVFDARRAEWDSTSVMFVSD
jgi:hypothetical protein